MSAFEDDTSVNLAALLLRAQRAIVALPASQRTEAIEHLEQMAERSVGKSNGIS